MRLRYKLLTTLLALSMSVPTFAMVKLEDTFTYGNIANTIGMAVNYKNGTVTNNYILASDNTIMVKGPSAAGVGGATNNSTTIWKPVVTDASGTTLNNIVNISTTYNLYAIDNSGNAYYINNYPEKINLEGVKFKDVGEAYSYYYYGAVSTFVVYLISEDGYVYKGKNTEFTKMENVVNIDSIYTTTMDKSNGSSRVVYTLLLGKDGSLYRVTNTGDCTKVDGVMNVDAVYPAYTGFYLKFKSGKIGYLGSTGNTVTDVLIPNGETFNGVIADSTVVCLITDSNVYTASGATLTEATAVNTEDQSPIKPVTSGGGDIAIDKEGNYYTWKLSGKEFQFTPLNGIEEWANENPIVLESELANFDIPLNKIFKRLENYEFTFNLVTKEQPKKFNIYFCKNEDRNDKLKWQLIEGNVDVSTLNPEVYDTGYVNASGKPITDFSYKYDWQVGDEDLVGVHLIVEPIYQ